jgi:hypothetical protein
MLPEEFIDLHWNQHPVAPALNPSSTKRRKIVVHGHCHQKALTGMEHTKSVLERCAPSCHVEILDSGCCGMAGAFGYMRTHYDMSVQMSELALSPAVRDLPANSIVAAPGTSCRHQIRDTTGRHALHPMEIIADAIGES